MCLAYPYLPVDFNHNKEISLNKLILFNDNFAYYQYPFFKVMSFVNLNPNRYLSIFERLPNDYCEICVTHPPVNGLRGSNIVLMEILNCFKT